MNDRARQRADLAAACALICVLPVLCGCLETKGKELPGYSPHLLPAGTKLPSVEDDEVLAARIDNNDAVDELVLLRTAYAAGQEVRYWDFGTASASAEPLWQFRKRGAGDEPEEIGHLDLIDSVPGDQGYSPIRALYRVYVTDAYDGELITTVQALEDAIELGLVEEPEALGIAVNWPVVPAGTMLETGWGDALSPTRVYYRGQIATHFRLGDREPNVGAFPVERGQVGKPTAYVLRRQNEAKALEEPLWNADLNTDGDTLDSNVVFTKNAGDEGYTSLWQPVEVTVAADYAWGTTRAEGDLFERTDLGLVAIDGALVEYAQGESLLNRPIQYAP